MKVQKQTKEQEPVKNAHLLYQLKNLNKEIEALTEKKAELSARIVKEYGLGKHETEDLNVNIYTTTTLNAKKLKEVFTFDEHPQFYTQTIDSAGVRREISEKDLEDFLTQSKPIIKITEKKEY